MVRHLLKAMLAGAVALRGERVVARAGLAAAAAADHGDRRARRAARCDGAACRQASDGGARPAGGGREPSRRRRQHGGAGGRQGRARRLHAAAHRHQSRDQSDADSGRRLRLRARSRAGDDGGGGEHGAGRASVAAAPTMSPSWSRSPKQKPNEVTIAISPIGTPNHLGAELLAQKGRHRPDLRALSRHRAGHAGPAGGPGASSRSRPMSSIYPHVAAGSLKALAVTRPVRSPFAPAIPTVAEVRHPGLRRQRLGLPDDDRRHAGAGHRAAQRRGAQGDGAARGARQLRQAGARSIDHVARASLAPTSNPNPIKWADVLKNAKVKKQ